MTQYTGTHVGDVPLPKIDFEFAETLEEKDMVAHGRFMQMAGSIMLKGEDGAWSTTAHEAVRIFVQINPRSTFLPENDDVRAVTRRLHGEAQFRNMLMDAVGEYVNRDKGKTAYLGSWTYGYCCVRGADSYNKVSNNDRPWWANPRDVEGQMTFNWEGDTR